MARYNPSYEGIGKMLVSPEMQATMLKLAEKVKTRAEQIAPFDPKSEDGTHFKDSFETSVGIRHSADGHSRARARVSNTDPAALWIELGTSDTPKHRTLGKALDSLKE